MVCHVFEEDKTWFFNPCKCWKKHKKNVDILWYLMVLTRIDDVESSNGGDIMGIYIYTHNMRISQTRMWICWGLSRTTSQPSWVLPFEWWSSPRILRIRLWKHFFYQGIFLLRAWNFFFCVWIIVSTMSLNSLNPDCFLFGTISTVSFPAWSGKVWNFKAASSTCRLWWPNLLQFHFPNSASFPTKLQL